MLYEELLAQSQPRFRAFFKNVRIFENQLCWSDFHARCYHCLYTHNSYENQISVFRARREIDGLEEMCIKCREYFVPKRNESIPRYDLIMGRQMEEELMKFLQKKLGAMVCRGDQENPSYPDCRIVRADGTTAAYFEVKYHAAPFVYSKRFTGRECYEGSATLDYQKIQKQLALIEREISVPVYYLHWIDYPCLKGVFYETAEALKTRMEQQHAEFTRKKREGDDKKAAKYQYFSKVYAYLLELGSFEEMLEELRACLADPEPPSP